MEKDVLYLVLPCYNEEETIEISHRKLRSLMDSLVDRKIISSESKMLFVDDGSSDKTWSIIDKLHRTDDMVEGVKLAQNRGHQVALYAGIEAAVEKADAIITIDVDLQQDINAIPRFMASYEKGSDIVFGIRNDRQTDGFFKKHTALIYYKLMRMVGAGIVPNSADYRLMSRRSARALLQYKESNLFIRGLITTLGFKTDKVYFDVHEREQGSSKYTIHKMLKLALDGITSFSIFPIRCVLYLGLMVLLVSICVMIHDFFDWYNGNTVDGWASLELSIWFFGGVQLVSIGIIGEYVGRIYMESKRRPRYIIEENTIK
ncbi:glycosyltransferase family 2 protein [Butyrivibrio sp. MC2013]|uniref:glycosyltransferase family 2 protein n=1 Tax=Butyrivibrio sp. MC2013 TaxID=1280686 RepID=UPI00042407F0|nr:glycosyltransferase family 2 protein [Butyrivibrio sp. MC2013]